MTDFATMLREGYGSADASIILGAAIEPGAGTHREPLVALPLATLNRHGLIAGATGTGKTRTLQLLAEQLSAAGVPVFVSDVKGDLSGLAMPGAAHPKIDERAAAVGRPWAPSGFPVEFVSLSGQLGVQVRATVSSFGPLLLAKVLDLNETQSGVLALVFRYCDDRRLPLLDFADLRTVLQYLSRDEAKSELADYGGMSRATVGVLLRKMLELEEQGADRFFGEPEFDVHDLLHVAGGRGVITCLELADVQDRPRLFSTFMMWLLAELYQNLPEVGDLPQPKLVFFFDEAHLLFDGASKAFMDQLEQVVRLVRSKGVGVFFVTQTPRDVPKDVLAQLGTRVQHALRAHTPDDDKAIRATARTFPKTTFYDLEETLTTLGTGEAVVTGLDARGRPTPTVATHLVAPSARMAPLTPDELQADIRQSDLLAEYGTPVDRESAHELLARRMTAASGTPLEAEEGSAPEPRDRAGRGSKAAGAVIGGAFAGALGSAFARTVGREVVRGLFGMLGARPPRRTRRRRSW